MKAAFNTELKTFEIRDVALPTISDDEVLVRVKACGICGSDKHEFGRNKKPSRIAGHEFAGIVEKVGSAVKNAKVGDRVTASPITSKGTIGYQRPGAFAEYTAVPSEALLPIPTSTSFPYASLTEPVAVGLHASTRTSLQGKSACVFGAGTIGILTAICARAQGAREVWMVDLDEKHLKIAEDLGFKTYNSTSGFGGLGKNFDVVFECVGHIDALLNAALGAVKNFGEVVLLGFGHPNGIPTDTIVHRRLSIFGSGGVSMAELAASLELIATGTIPADRLVSATFPLTKMNEAFAASLNAQKIVIEP